MVKGMPYNCGVSAVWVGLVTYNVYALKSIPIAQQMFDIITSQHRQQVMTSSI